MKKLLPPMILEAIVLGGCTYAFPVAPLYPGVAISLNKDHRRKKADRGLKRIHSGISLENPKTVEEAARKPESRRSCYPR